MISTEQFVTNIMSLADPSSEYCFSGYAKKKLVELVKCSDKNVKSCFFNEVGNTDMPYEITAITSELAVRYVSYIIGNSGNQQIASKISTVSYEDIGMWFEYYAEKIGRAILKSYIEKNFCLPIDMACRRKFFEEVAALLCKDYFEGVTKLISTTSSPRPAQILLAVLRECDFLAYSKVRIEWANSRFFGENFKDYNILTMLDEFPYFDEYKNADILSSMLEDEVNNAIKKNAFEVNRWIDSPDGPCLYGLKCFNVKKNNTNEGRFPYSGMYMIYHDKKHDEEKAVNNLALYNDKLYVNGSPAIHYGEGNKYIWKDGNDIGSVWFYHYGLAAEGYTISNGIKRRFSAVSEDVSYRLRYHIGNADKEIILKIGTRISAKTGGSLIYGALHYQGNKVIESYSSSDGIHIDDGASDNGFFKTEYVQGKLNLKLSLGDVLWSVLGEDMMHSMFGCDFDIWRAELTLSRDFQSISGKIWEQNTSGFVTKEGTCYKCEGEYIKPDAIVNLECNRLEVTPRMRRDIRNLYSSLGEAPKSITELYTLPAPNMKEANVLASQTLYNLMVYYVSDKIFECAGAKIEWGRWFGKNKNSAKEMVVNVDSCILELVDGENANADVQNFLVSYAKGALANSYSSASDKDIEDALAGARSRLGSACTLPELCSYYMQGDGDTSMSSDRGYNIAIEVINKYAYAKLTPGLLKYIDDTSVNWAEQLYEQCVATLPQLKLEALSGGSTDVSHKTMMLNILDDRKYDNLVSGVDGDTVLMTYGAAIYSKVFNLQLTQIANALGIGFTGDVGTPDFVKMMSEIYNIMWVELQKETSDYFSDEILKVFREERKKFQDLEQEEYVQECIDMTIAGMEMVQAGATISSVIPKLSEISKKPSAMYTGLTCSIVFYAISIGSLATVFMKWDKTSVAEKIEAVLVCIQGVCQIGVAVIKVISMRTLMNPNASASDRINAAMRLNMDKDEMFTIKELSKVNGKEIDKGMESMSEECVSELSEGGVEEYTSKFTKFFKVAEYAVRCLTIALMGFVTIMSAVELSKAVKEGGYTTAIYLEIISTTLMGITCVLEGVVLVADILSVTCSYIPVIGAACCFVGLILQVVAMAINKPVNPMVRFITDEINPFLNKLDIPSVEWINNHKNKKDNSVGMIAVFA